MRDLLDTVVLVDYSPDLMVEVYITVLPTLTEWWDKVGSQNYGR